MSRPDKVIKRITQNLSTLFCDHSSIMIAGEQILSIPRLPKMTQRAAQELQNQIMKHAEELFTAQNVHQLISSMGDDTASQRAVGSLFALFMHAAGQQGWWKTFFTNLLASVTFMSRPVRREPKLYPWKVAFFVGLIHGAELAERGLSRNSPYQVLLDLFGEIGKGDIDACGLLVDIYETCAWYELLFVPRRFEPKGIISTVALWDMPDECLDGYHFFEANRLIIRPSHDIATLAELVEKKIYAVYEYCVDLWTEIESQPRYDVRLQGSDWYRVAGRVGKWRGSERYFIREGSVFPNVCIVTQHGLNAGVYYDGRSLSLETIGWALESEQYCGKDPTLAMTICNYLANLIAYHRIVCREPRVGMRRSHAGSQRNRTGEEGIREIVRAHFRRLYPGWTPSAGKEAEAIARLGRLPAGYTFVTDHDRQASEWGRDRITGSGAVAYSTEPLFTVDPESVVIAL